VEKISRENFEILNIKIEKNISIMVIHLIEEKSNFQGNQRQMRRTTIISVCASAC